MVADGAKASEREAIHTPIGLPAVARRSLALLSGVSVRYIPSSVNFFRRGERERERARAQRAYCGADDEANTW